MHSVLVYCLEHNLTSSAEPCITCLHHLLPPGHKLIAPLCCYCCLSLLSDLQNVKQTNNCSSTQHCNNPCIFTAYSPKWILYCTINKQFIRLLAVLSRFKIKILSKMEKSDHKPSPDARPLLSTAPLIVLHYL